MFPSYLIIWASSLPFIWGQYCFFFFFFFNVQLDYPLNYNKYIKKYTKLNKKNVSGKLEVRQESTMSEVLRSSGGREVNFLRMSEFY